MVLFYVSAHRVMTVTQHEHQDLKLNSFVYLIIYHMEKSF